MFATPTMLPDELRLLVDPPVQFPEVLDTPRELVESSLWTRVKSALPWQAERNTTGRPCEDAPSAIRSIVRPSSPCTD